MKVVWDLTNPLPKRKVNDKVVVNPVGRDQLREVGTILVVTWGGFIKDPDTTAKRVGPYMDQHREQPFIAYLGAKPVGCVSPRLDKETKAGVLDGGVHVLPAFRRQRIGTTLLLTALQWLKENGMQSAWVTPFNPESAAATRRAETFYLATGAKIERLANEQDIQKKAKKYLTKSRAGDWEHTLRVVKWMKFLIEREGGDPDVLILAAYLHDVGWSIAIPPDYKGKPIGSDFTKEMATVHMKKGAELAQTILKDLGYPKKKTSRIVHLVSIHDQPDKIEQKDEVLLMEADRLDRLGKAGVERIKTQFKPELWDRIFSSTLTKSQEWFRTKTGTTTYHTLLDEMKEELRNGMVSQIKEKIRPSKKTIEAFGYHTEAVSAQELYDGMTGEIFSPDIMTLRDVLGNEYLMIHEVVEISELKKMGRTIDKRVVMDSPKAVMYKAHFVAQELELKYAVSKKDYAWMKIRLRAHKKVLQDDPNLPKALKPVAQALYDKFLQIEKDDPYRHHDVE